MIMIMTMMMMMMIIITSARDLWKFHLNIIYGCRDVDKNVKDPKIVCGKLYLKLFRQGVKGFPMTCTLKQTHVSYINFKVVVFQGPVTRGNFLCNLHHNVILKQVAEEIARLTPLLFNVQSKEKLRSKLQKKLNNLLLFATLRSQLQRVTCLLHSALQRTVAIMA